MERDDIFIESGVRWQVNTAWLQHNRRSLTTMAAGALCAKCHKKLKTDQGEARPGDIIKAVRTCCSKEAGFVTSFMPLQEAAFRVFLATGNQPMTLEELSKQLAAFRGVDAYPVSVTTLSRLFRNDRHYGIQPVGERS